jgi:ubiquinone/menaquinone biosynthesis C-methylase UbiE
VLSNGEDGELSVRDNRDEEIARYVEHYKSPKYGMGQRRQADVQRILQDLRRGSLLDVSTGRGETLRFAKSLGFSPVQGTEVVPELLNDEVVFAQAHSLPFPDNSFDHVTCFDVLEHLVEADIRPALQEMYRVARISVTVSASERPSVFGDVDLHISKRPAPEWHRLIRDCWDKNTKRIGKAGGSPAFQVIKYGPVA